MPTGPRAPCLPNGPAPCDQAVECLRGRCESFVQNKVLLLLLVEKRQAGIGLRGVEAETHGIHVEVAVSIVLDAVGLPLLLGKCDRLLVLLDEA